MAVRTFLDREGDAVETGLDFGQRDVGREKLAARIALEVEVGRGP